MIAIKPQHAPSLGRLDDGPRVHGLQPPRHVGQRRTGRQLRGPALLHQRVPERKRERRKKEKCKQ
jgi:hypothetical protein